MFHIRTLDELSINNTPINEHIPMKKHYGNLLLYFGGNEA